MEEMQAQLIEGGGDMNPFRQLESLPERGEALLSEEELEFYAQAFAKSGFHGGISWYRNFDRNWNQNPEFGVEKINHPALMITAENDMALQPAMAADMPSRCSDLEMVMIPQCGHWTQQEKPGELNRIMIDWLTKRFA
jgi:pimeloyl-ACP methyl ester carboxylesterase